MHWSASLLTGWLLLSLAISGSAQTFDREGWRTLTESLDYSEQPAASQENGGAPDTGPVTGEPAGSGLSLPGQTAALIGIALAVAVLVALLLRQQGWWGGKKSSHTPYSLSAAEAQLPTAELDPLLSEALAHQDYRTALRIQFLRVVQHFHRERIIRWRPDGTNRQYVHEVKAAHLQPAFRQLVRWYETVWYGQTDLTAVEYEALQPIVQVLLPPSVYQMRGDA